ncbi:MAG: hypothetical protein IJO67_08280 [Clostridia bacterium]|nr:hypothetical protein [Clostridia bacterium]
MTRKKKKRLIFAGIGFVILAAAAICLYNMPISLGGTGVARPAPLPGDTVLSSQQVQQDRQQMIDYVERVHPFFIDGSDQTAYLAAKEKYVAATQEEMTVDAFMSVTAEYLTVFGDGHTKLSWQYGEEVLIYHSFREGKMYYADANGVTDQWITAVDDVPIEQIFDTIDHLFPAENEMAVRINYNNYFTSENLLKVAGVNVEKDTFTVTLNDGSQVTCGWYVPPETTEAAALPERNQWYMEGDIFVVRFVSCDDDENLKSIANELKKAVEGGCTKVIIDARGNGGGSSNACERLLEAMGMKAPNYGTLVRYSPAAKTQKGYLRSSGTFRNAPNASARQNSRVQLVVLCDRFTYSSATMLCVYVQDGKLGTLIGEPSSNMPNHYGDITYVALENSHLYASVSHKRFLRPSGETNGRMVVPDIETSSENAWQAALDYLNRK